MYAIAYNVFMLLCCGYAALYGGRWERIGAALMFTGSMITTAVVIIMGSYEHFVLFIDILMLGALLVLALRADKYWPLWAAGFHTVGLGTHLAVLVDAAIAPIAHAHALGLWSYLTLLSLALGVRQHRLHLASTPVANIWQKFLSPFVPQKRQNRRTD